MYPDISSQVVGIFTPYYDLAARLLVAIVMLLLGWILALITYSVVRWIIEKLGIQRYIQKFSEGDSKVGSHDIGTVIAKSLAVFIFILVVRKVVMFLGFYEIEGFLTDLINYLPNLFIALLIAFFGIRFSKTIYNIVLETSHFSDQKTAKVLAYIAKTIVLFFTLMIALHYIKIVDVFIINTIVVGFIGMVSLAGGIAFGLGGQTFAGEMLGNLKEGMKPANPPSPERISNN